MENLTGSESLAQRGPRESQSPAQQCLFSCGGACSLLRDSLPVNGDLLSHHHHSLLHVGALAICE